MPLQVPQLDDRNFDQILAETVKRIPVHTPEWNNFNDSDPGMTLVQLFSFMAENLVYRSNRIPEANRLKFLSLLGIPLRPATSARGLVVYNNDRGPVQKLPFDAGMELFAGKVPFRTRTPVNILPVTAEVFYKKPKDITPDEEKVYKELYGNDGKKLTYYQATPLKAPQVGQKTLPEVNIGKTDLEDVDNTIDQALWVALVAPKNVPPELARDIIAGETLSVGIYPSMWTEGKILEAKTLEQQTVTSGLTFDAAILITKGTQNTAPVVGYQRLEIESAEDVLEMPGIIQVKLPKDGIEPYSKWDFDPIEEGAGNLPPFIEDNELSSRIIIWLRVSLAVNDPTSQRGRLSWVGVNSARVIQALRVDNERLGTGTGTPNQTLKVTNTPVILEPMTDPIPGQIPDRTFELEVANEQGVMETWRMTDDLYAELPDAKVYNLDPESGQITFGDGLRGARPTRGAVIQATYEYGGGLDGKVAIGAINKASALPGGVKVANSVDTWGASQSETAADGERRISSFLKHQDRLVTAEDFREITLRTPGVDIARVEVLPLFRPNNQDGTAMRDKDDNPDDPGSITVMVIPKHDIAQPDPPDPTKFFLQAVVDWLDPRRLVTTQVFVRGPFFIPIVVSLGIVTMPGQSSFVVQSRVKEAIRRYLSPAVGGPEMTNSDGQKVGIGWSLENALRPQDLAAAASRVEGVRYVNPPLLGKITPEGTIVEQSEVAISGLQLPWLSAIDVQEDQPTELSKFDSKGASDNPDPSTAVLPVPLMPRKC